MIKYCSDYWNDTDKVLKCVPNIERIRNKSVLITGGTGMIGSTLVDLLLYSNKQYNYNVKIILAGRSLERICRRFHGFQNNKDYFFIPYDATTNQVLDIATDYIIHGASNANPIVYTKEPVETILANIVGLNSLLAGAVRQGCKRVLYISSSEVYGKKEDNLPYKEDDYGYVDILNPRGAYPCSKRAGESLCVAYSQEYGLDTVIVRPGHIYGPSITDADSRASAEFTRNAVKGEDIVMKSAGTQLRSYCYTLDCASAILTVLLNGKGGNAYNVSNKDSIVTISDIAMALANVAGSKVVFKQATEMEKKGYNLMSNSSLDAEKLKQLGWEAVFNLQEGTKKTIRYYE